LLLHGEAVAIGLAATARYAWHEGQCSADHASEILAQIQRLGLPMTSDACPADLRARLAEISDHRGGRMRLVVPTDSGAQVLESCDVDLLLACAQGLPVAR
jgi:3-dehydroquinate synthetase